MALAGRVCDRGLNKDLCNQLITGTMSTHTMVEDSGETCATNQLIIGNMSTHTMIEDSSETCATKQLITGTMSTFQYLLTEMKHIWAFAAVFSMLDDDL